MKRFSFTLMILSMVLLFSMSIAAPRAEAQQPQATPNGAARRLTASQAQAPEVTGTWVGTGSMSQGRFQHTATLLNDGTVLVAGGACGHLCTTDTAELYNPKTGKWTATGKMKQARFGHTATLLHDGTVLVAGGETSTLFFASAELYNPSTGEWTSTGNMKRNRSRHTATLLQDGRVLVAGGVNHIEGGLYMAELYNPQTREWTETGWFDDLLDYQGIFQHTATRLNDGTVLVAGGVCVKVTDPEACTTYHTPHGASFEDEVMRYDPEKATWGDLSHMNSERSQHTATLLNDGTGTVLMAGGYGGHGTLNTAELCDPKGCTDVGSMSNARYDHTATLLLNGKVLVAGGGTYTGNWATAELYNPQEQTWGSAGSMSVARYSHTATLLPDGTVLVAGGYDALKTAELYRPVSARSPARVYLPLVFGPAPLPDLSVQSINVTSTTLQITLQNNGNAPVTNDFWVDLYVNPNPVPTRVNQTWQMTAPYGAVWGVTASALPLNPGGTLTLSVGDAYYWFTLSNLPSTLTAGTWVYAQADSYNPSTTYGNIVESDENGVGGYNNIQSTQLAAPITLSGVTASPHPSTLSPNRLPKR